LLQNNSGAIEEFPIKGFEGGWGGNIIKKLFFSDSNLPYIFLN